MGKDALHSSSHRKMKDKAGASPSDSKNLVSPAFYLLSLLVGGVALKWKLDGDSSESGVQLAKDPSRVWNYSEVDRRGPDLSYEEFVTEYLLPRRAVVIEGLAKQMLPRRWGWDYLKKQCEFNGVRLYSYQPEVTASEGNSFFADLVQTEESIALADYLDDIEDGMAGRDSKFYNQRALVFDAFMEGCGLEDFTYPKYVTNDIIKRSKLNEHELDPYREQPSFFFGMNHTKRGPSGGGLHRDSYASHFWQALAEGTKEWVVICGLDPAHREEVLYPHKRTVLEGSQRVQTADPQNYRLNAFKPDFKKFPKARQALETNAVKFVANEGDFVFVPADCPHQVRTLSPRSVAVAQNFVDSTNLELFLQEIANYGSQDILSGLKSVFAGKQPPFLRDPPELKYKEHGTYGRPRPWEEGAATLKLPK